MSTVFRTLFEASTVKEGGMRADLSQESGRVPRADHALSRESDLRSIAFLQTKEFSG